MLKKQFNENSEISQGYKMQVHNKTYNTYNALFLAKRERERERIRALRQTFKASWHSSFKSNFS